MMSIAQLKNMLNKVPGGVGLYKIGSQQGALYLNDAFFELIGYTREAYAAVAAQPFPSFICPEDRWIYEENVRKMQSQGFVKDCEYRVVRPDGSLRWVQLNVSPMEMDENTVYFATFTDITRTKAAEFSGERAVDRYRLILESTNTAVFEWNYETAAFYCSESMKDYALGRIDPQNIFINKGLVTTVHPDDLSVLEQFFVSTARHKEKSECVLRLRMTNGDYRWSRMICILQRNQQGAYTRAVGAIMDINDDMEKAIMMQSLVNALPGGVAIFKFAPHIQCLYFNDALIRFGNWSRTELQAVFDSPDCWEKLIAPADRELFRTEVLEKVKTGEPINLTFRYFNPASEQKFGWTHLSAVKIREEDGYPVYYAILTAPPDESKIYQFISENSLIAELVLECSAGKILHANRALKQLAETPEIETVIGRDYTAVFHPMDAACLQEEMAALEKAAYVERLITASCGKHLLVRGHTLDWNGRKACMFYLSDRTEIMQQNRQLMDLLNHLPSGIGLFELTGQSIVQLYLNDGFYQMLEDTREKRMSYSDNQFVQAIHPEDRALLENIHANLLRGDKRLELTCRMRSGKGEYLWIHLVGTVEAISDGRTILYCSFSDVNQQMKAQLSLQKDQIMLKLAMQTAKMSSWEFDVVQKCIHQDETSQFQHGYEKLVENVPESLIADGFVHPSSAEVYRKLFASVTKAEGVLQGDAYVRTVDRKGYWWERIIMMPIFDQNGKHIRSIGTTIDITEQKVLETKYKQQVQAFNSANSLNLIAKGIYNLSRSRVECYHGETDDAVKVETIHTYEDGLNGTAALFVNQQEAEKFQTQFNRQTLMQQLGTGNAEITYEYQRKTAQGKIIWAKTTGKLYSEPTSGDTMCFIYSYDINEQKTAQDMIDTVVRVDYDYLALLDCRTLDYTVYANSENLRTPLPPFHSSDYEREVEEYAKMYLLPEDVEQNIHDMCIANICEQLKTKDSFVAYAAMRENDGTVGRKKLQFSYLDRANQKVLITRVDITDVYRREQEQSRELREANNAKAEFLSHMSHDLRTPMNAIIGLSELAQDELNDPAAMKSYVGNIQSAGQFLLGLVSDCLDFEKLSAHKMQLHNVPYLYQEFRDSMTMMIAPLCRQKQIAFTFTQSAPYTVFIDKVRFEQIFFNLLSNAVKYTQTGGKVEFIADSHLNEDQSLVLCDFYVRDNGIGMSEEFQQRLFMPFEQEIGDGRAPQQGTGLGLSIVKELVELMGGTIRIRSRQGEGTEVMVHLDMVHAPGMEYAPQRPQSAAELERLSGKTILLLEDQPLNMTIAKKLLEKHKITVVCAENGSQGLEKFAQSPVNFFDAILTDIRMPVMSGLDVSKKIRALDRMDAKTVPIIAMTANAFEEDMQESQKAGMNAHLSKPIDPGLLYQTLLEWIFHNHGGV